MSNLIRKLQSAGFDDRVITDKQLSRLLGGGDASRYGLVNRALKDGGLTRIKRGLYALSGARRAASIHPYVVAQSLVPGSYVSFETALSHHGWIPEAVYTTTSVTPGRKSIERNTDTFGQFSFQPLATEPFGFLVSVDRVQFGASAALIAKPLRAFMDLVARRKLAWSGLDWVTGSLRVDPSALDQLRRDDFMALRSVYKHRQVRMFLGAFERALTDAKPGSPRQGRL